MESIKFNRIWAMPSKHTFTIKPIKELILKYVHNYDEVIVDPFCGGYTLGNITNDMNTSINAMFHLDAFEFLKQLQTEQADIILYDPPYSFRQVKECYNSIGKDKFDPRQTRADYWSDVKNECARVIKSGGTVICCGWNSGGLGINRGFKLLEVLLVPHGGGHNDTIITVERKNNV